MKNYFNIKIIYTKKEDYISMWGNMELKDKITFIGIIITAIIGVANLIFSMLNTKRNVYANTVLKERLDSLNSLKKNTAELLSLSIESSLNNEVDKNYRELKKLSYLIQYQFNFKKREEKKAINEINYLMELMFLKNIDTLSERIEFIQKDRLHFFVELSLEFYDYKRLTDLIDKKILECVNDLELLFREHIKMEWEKVKKNQKVFK